MCSHLITLGAVLLWKITSYPYKFTKMLVVSKEIQFLLNKHRGIVHSMLGVCLENTDVNS